MIKSPIRVGLIGAGYAATGFAFQCAKTKGLHLIAVSNRTAGNAKKMLNKIGISNPKRLNKPADIKKLQTQTETGFTDDPSLLLTSNFIDVIVEATGDVEFGAYIAYESIKARKHIILINAELDCTLGPILKKKADDVGVIYSQADGDQPGVIMNLIREAEFMGMRVVMAGNIKTMLDQHRTPETQKAWAKKNNQSTTLATSAVDGTKLAAEMASVANAAGFSVAIRGMHGFSLKHVDDAQAAFKKLNNLNKAGIVDYIIGAQPSFGVFIVARCEKPLIRKYLKMYKLGNGPLYTLYRPFHLCTLEAHKSVVQAVVFKNATLAPRGLYCEVIAMAKRELKSGEILDGIGGFTTFGMIENSRVVRKQNLLPIGLSKGCVLRKSVKKDKPITFSDVAVPKGRLIDKLYIEQKNLF